MSDVLTGRPWAQAPWELVTADISANAFRICMAIQLHRRPDGEAPFPGQTRLAKMCHLSVPTVKRAIAELREAGILTATQRTRSNGTKSTNSYSLRMPTGDHGRSPAPGITGDPTEVEFSVGKDLEPDPGASPHGGGGAAGRAERDAMWDVLTAEFGDPATKTERSNRGRQVRELLDAGAAPGDMPAARREWERRYPGATLTANALVAHWGELRQRSRRPRPQPKCPECEMGGGLHAADCPRVQTQRGGANGNGSQGAYQPASR